MVIQKAKGCYITDNKGTKYIDTTMGSGAQIIGHGNPLIKKIQRQIKRGTIYTIPNNHTNVVNELLSEINPHFHNEYIFCNSGTEANMRSIRLARAYTKRDIIGRFHGGWHGGLDGFIDGEGVPDKTNSLFKILPYNDDKCFDMITEDMAAVIIEPVQGSNPRTNIKSFLVKLRRRCDELGVLLIFDEIMTGFRIGKQGGQGLFDVIPDLITYGKVLGGGFPIGCVGGKSEIMKTKDVFYGGTFSANPLTMYGAKLILETIINKKYINYDQLNFVGKLFRDKLNEFFIIENKKIRVMGCGPINRLIFTDKFIRNRKDRDEFESQNQIDFFDRLLKNGVFVNTNGIFHFSMSHSEKIINKIIEKINEIFSSN